MFPNNEVGGPDSQTARLNSGGDALKQVAEDAAYEKLTAGEKAFAWSEEVKARLGVTKLTGDIPNDIAALQKGVAAIVAAGGPVPIRVRYAVAYPNDPSLSVVLEKLVFTHFNNPNLQYAADELLVAVNPQVVINDLAKAGIRRQ